MRSRVRLHRRQRQRPFISVAASVPVCGNRCRLSLWLSFRFAHPDSCRRRSILVILRWARHVAGWLFRAQLSALPRGHDGMENNVTHYPPCIRCITLPAPGSPETTVTITICRRPHSQDQGAHFPSADKPPPPRLSLALRKRRKAAPWVPLGPFQVSERVGPEWLVTRWLEDVDWGMGICFSIPINFAVKTVEMLRS
jgi:hypothetical protein